VNALSLLRARPRLLLSLALGLAVYFVLPSTLAHQTRFIIGWDVGTAVFLGAALIMMLRANIDRMRRRAAQQDAGRVMILALTVAAVGASVLAIGFELHEAKGLPASQAGWRVGLAALTVLLSWSFTHTIFAIHYAHEDYRDGKAGGLVFPGDEPPDYLDFMYYAFVVGMTCQVSDIQVADPMLRRLTLVHGVLSFFFNTVILALAINLAAGLF
jgi:uncharacterized membrane protein